MKTFANLLYETFIDDTKTRLKAFVLDLMIKLASSNNETVDQDLICTEPTF